MNRSTYSKILAIYSRCPETHILYCIDDKKNNLFEDYWQMYVKFLKTLKGQKKPNGIMEYVISNESIQNISNVNVSIKISEIQCKNETQIRGIITTIGDENSFDDWFLWHILCQTKIEQSDIPKISGNRRYAEEFTEYFENNLKNTIKKDEWFVSGRAKFLEKVTYFTDRYIKIECILPAFPCKSSNVNKVFGHEPDRGEELALRRLIKFNENVKKFYPPGCKIWIVSDGHVFSDCIGVDDGVVDSYTANLHKLYKGIDGNSDAIEFCGLKDLFFGNNNNNFQPEWVSNIFLPHYTGSTICPISELSRKILMQGCDTDNGKLKNQIHIPDHPRLHLYRGFSKFMTEDLSLLSFFSSMSKKQFKKTVAKVAFEMIKRNDAYSNLVDLVFPHHLRFSIHAHTNSGPKYGIRVISYDQCKTVKSFESNEEPTFEDLLHIPTPWHNCVIQIENAEKNDRYYLAKSRTVYEALKKGCYQGKWINSDIKNGIGGYFLLRKTNN